ncbi:MAG: diaminopropionate ammonia-lyase [Arenicellales bacterium]
MESIYGTAEIHHLHNPEFEPDAGYPVELAEVLDAQRIAEAQDEISRWDGYAPTPLHSLDTLAQAAGVAGVYYKDEGRRFEPGSFKALGGAYAVQQLLRREIGQRRGADVSLEDVRARRYGDIAAGITVATATDGNHGRSVAWGASRFGCSCVIYVHRAVSEGRRAAMEAYGATVVRVDGNYDDSVRRAEADAQANGWFIVSDTSYPGYTSLPKYVMAGYTLMIREALSQIPAGHALTHVFLQGGCGGLAASVAAYLWQTLGASRPRLVAVEPMQADCLYQSVRSGRRTDVNITEESLMAGLSCGEVSALAWTVVRRAVNDFVAMNEDLVAPSMRLLARGGRGWPPIVAGESGVPGLAVMLAAARQPGLRDSLDIGSGSEVLLIGTEGATDPEIYERLVGADRRT